MQKKIFRQLEKKVNYFIAQDKFKTYLDLLTTLDLTWQVQGSYRKQYHKMFSQIFLVVIYKIIDNDDFVEDQISKSLGCHLLTIIRHVVGRCLYQSLPKIV